MRPRERRETGEQAIGDSGIKARVASRLLECVAKGDVSVEGLRAAGRCALEEVHAT